MNTVPACDCHSAYQLREREQKTWSQNSSLLDNLECRVPGSANRRLRLDDREILEILDCTGAVIQVSVPENYDFPETSVVDLDPYPGWIWIPRGPWIEDSYPDPRGQKCPRKIKIVNKFHRLKF